MVVVRSYRAVGWVSNAESGNKNELWQDALRGIMPANGSRFFPATFCLLPAKIFPDKLQGLHELSAGLAGA